MSERIKNGLDVSFHPDSIALVGASPTPGKLGHSILQSILEGGYQGRVFPVNPKGGEILGLQVFKSVKDIPGDVALAIFVIPAFLIPSSIKEFRLKKLKSAIVITAGFKESGEQGKKLGKEAVNSAKEIGTVMIGPNCAGVYSSSANLNARLTTIRPTTKGGVSILSQSGAVFRILLTKSMDIDLGFSKSISTGNEEDLTSADYLEYLGEDNETSCIGLYLEGIQDGRRFLKVSRDVTRHKPIIVMKAGVGEAGIRATASHTGALTGSDQVFSSVCRQVGMVRVNDWDEMFSTLMGFSDLEPPKGDGVGIITIGGGIGIEASESCERSGLTVPKFSDYTTECMAKVLPAIGSLYVNPVDVGMVPQDKFVETYRECVRLMLKDENIHSLIMSTVGHFHFPTEFKKMAIEARKTQPKPVVVYWIVTPDPLVKSAIKELRENKVPVYTSSRQAAIAIAALVKYTQYRNKLKERGDRY